MTKNTNFKSINRFNVSSKSKDSNKYINKRYKELINKGYRTEQAEKMIYFELGASAIVSERIESATVQDCMMAGRLVGTDIGATIGFAGGSLKGIGVGSFAGGVTGAILGKFTCERIIKIASEKAVQKTTERLWTQYKDPLKEDIENMSDDELKKIRKLLIFKKNP